MNERTTDSLGRAAEPAPRSPSVSFELSLTDVGDGLGDVTLTCAGIARHSNEGRVVLEAAGLLLLGELEVAQPVELLTKPAPACPVDDLTQLRSDAKVDKEEIDRLRGVVGGLRNDLQQRTDELFQLQCSTHVSTVRRLEKQLQDVDTALRTALGLPPAQHESEWLNAEAAQSAVVVCKQHRAALQILWQAHGNASNCCTLSELATFVAGEMEKLEQRAEQLEAERDDMAAQCQAQTERADRAVDDREAVLKLNAELQQELQAVEAAPAPASADGPKEDTHPAADTTQLEVRDIRLPPENAAMQSRRERVDALLAEHGEAIEDLVTAAWEDDEVCTLTTLLACEALELPTGQAERTICGIAMRAVAERRGWQLTTRDATTAERKTSDRGLRFQFFRPASTQKPAPARPTSKRTPGLK